MRHPKRLIQLVLAALATATIVVGIAPAAVSASPNSCGPWTDQQDMADTTGASCRSTWLVDPGIGQYLNRAQLMGAASMYLAQGFSRQWLWYAPEAVTHIPAGSGQEWTGCPEDLHYGGACPTGQTLDHHAVLHNFTGGPVDMDSFAWGGHFVSRICGNFGYPLEPTADPVPTIAGHKFDDRNHNGQQDPGEPGLPGWTFQLDRDSSFFADQPTGPVTSTTTGAGGDFTFPLNDIGPGTYTVHEIPQDDWAPTTADHQTVVVPAGAGDSTVANLLFGNTFQAITATGTPITAVEGQPVTATVATVTDPDQTADAAAYTASIDWGDSTPPSSGTLTRTGPGQFTVTGTHTYIEESSLTATVTVVDTDTPTNTATATSPVTVTDAALSATGNPNLLSTNPVTDLPVATFTDASPYGPVTDFTATVDWGDGIPATAGTVTGPTGGPFTVTGIHTYATLGPKTIYVHIVDDGGSTADAVSHLIVYGVPDGGDFATGDTSTSNGTHVTFWGAQWSKDNSLSGGTAPAAFKGFETSNPTPTCAATWTTQPGNSSNPPATIPTYMAVIVTSHVTQNGNTITGDTTHVVIVATNPGYANDPGHPGTGTIVATLC